ITPAHDADDYACAQRHGLPVVQVFAPDGTVVQDIALPEFAGMSRWRARERVIAALKPTGAYLGKRDAEQSVILRCSRSGDVIEPMLMPQWYVQCGKLAQQADGLVQTGAIELLPGRQRAVWHNWMSGIEDWCVSRQLWWVDDVWVAAESEQQAKEKAGNQLCANDRALVAGGTGCVAVQDEDVLDTWFSSGLLPLTAFNRSTGQNSVLAPVCMTDLSQPLPALSSVLETGQDILFFWVARMAMLCTHFARIPPFSTVLLHPMVRDAQGRKMSKSLGNVIDPMDIIDGAELARLEQTLADGYLSERELRQSTRELKRLYPHGFQRFGADALRFTLLLYTQQTQQINLSLESVKAAH
ncbi:hypothetical protein H4S02_011914, partial [Coemansia sp. RSA 2611]